MTGEYSFAAREVTTTIDRSPNIAAARSSASPAYVSVEGDAPAMSMSCSELNLALHETICTTDSATRWLQRQYTPNPGKQTTYL